MSLPVVKLLTLALRTLSKPVAISLKQHAAIHPWFRRFIIHIAQVLIPFFISCFSACLDFCWKRTYVFMLLNLEGYFFNLFYSLIFNFGNRVITELQRSCRGASIAMQWMLRFALWTRKEQFKWLRILLENSLSSRSVLCFLCYISYLQLLIQYNFK